MILVQEHFGAKIDSFLKVIRVDFTLCSKKNVTITLLTGPYWPSWEFLRPETLTVSTAGNQMSYGPCFVTGHERASKLVRINTE